MDSENSVNPCPPEDLDIEDNTLLRGDAIGDTAYTHRWVLRCLYTITEAMPEYLKSLKQNTNEESESSNLNQEDSTDNPILELDSKVEDAACQLWDMTVEKSVTEHLLELAEVDIMQLATLVFQESLSPRLTEVMIGVIANMCCQRRACEKILEIKDNNEMLLSTVHLLGGSSDVPTICEVLRFMKLLLWHRINRTSNSTWASCPLIKLLCQEYCRSAVAFMLNNSLSDLLITNLLDLLSSFLFVSLPETGLNVASLFSEKEIIDGLLELLKRKAKHITSNMNDDQSKIVHLLVVCLYAYIDTPGARLIINDTQKSDSTFETNILQCLELDGQIETYEQLIGEDADRLRHIIGLYQLIIPYLKVASSLMTIGKMLSLICGQTHQYSVSKQLSGFKETHKKGRSNSAEDTNFVEAVESSLIHRDSKNKERRHSSVTTQRQFSNPPVDEGGWLSPLVPTGANTDSPVTVPPQDVSTINESVTVKPLIKGSEDNSDDVSVTELKEAIEDFCYQLLAWNWSPPETEEKKQFQTEIFDTLDQCHAHEVLLILKAVRTKDRRLVPRLQEQLLDKGSHHRLVALLAFMYQ